jgi:hypothetical protein
VLVQDRVGLLHASAIAEKESNYEGSGNACKYEGCGHVIHLLSASHMGTGGDAGRAENLRIPSMTGPNSR